MALVLVAALLVSIAASFFLARALVRPLRALQQGAAQIGAGELDRRIEVARATSSKAWPSSSTGWARSCASRMRGWSARSSSARPS